MSADELIARYRIKWLYHFTDEANLPPIRQHGGLYSLEELKKRNIAVPRPGGNDWSRDADRIKGLHRFVHLSFTDNHPMRHVAERDGRIGPVKILQVDASVMAQLGVLFSADISNKSGVDTFPNSEAEQRIDFQVIYEWTDWRDPAIQARRNRAKRAEVLVPNHIPLRFLDGL